MERVLTMLGLAVKAGAAAIGEEPVGAAARAKKARVVLLAQDAAPSTRRRAMSFAAAGGCLCLTIPADKADLGRALGHTGCAMCAITDVLLAQAVVKKLAAVDGDKYGPAVAALEAKARRAVERRKEEARHKRNLRQGKRRVREPANDTPAPPADAAIPAEKPATQKPADVPAQANSSRPAESGPRRSAPQTPYRGTSDRPDRRGPYHNTKEGAKPPRGGAGRPAHSAGGADGAHHGERNRRPPRPAEQQKPRFAGSLPVKKGKGSKKSK